MAEDLPAIVFQNASGESGLPPAESFIRWARIALGEYSGGEVTIRVVGPAESQTLNRTFRNMDSPANVLAFPAGAPAAPLDTDELLPLGDLVICAAVVAEQAQAAGIAEEAHWAHMVTHGCLHLLGLDHQTPAEAQAMEATETRLLTSLGYPDPYA